MASKFSDLVTYFETIAKEHVAIAHSTTKKHFYRFEVEELLTGLCSDLNYPALILEGYDFNYGDSDSDNVVKRRGGAFMLIGLVTDAGDFTRIHQVWDELELIGDEILIRMRADKALRTVPVLRDFDISSCTGLLVKLAQFGQYGIRFTFSMNTAVDSTVDETRWNRNHA